MNWVALGLITAVLLGITRLVYRGVAKNAPVFGFTIALHFFGALFALPFFLYSVVFPSEPIAWILLGISVTIWTGAMILYAVSLKYTHASVREPIAQTQLLWSMFFAFVLLHESFTLSRTIGALCIVAGAVIVSVAHVTTRSAIRKGIVFTLLTALAWAAASIVDKQSMRYFTPAVYNFLEYAIIFVFLLVFLLFAQQSYRAQTRAFLKRQWPVMALCGLLSTAMYLASISTLQLADASLAYPLIQSGSGIAIIGGMIFFPEERHHIKRKALAAILIVVGAVLVVNGV